jgi:hypothetical protein
MGRALVSPYPEKCAERVNDPGAVPRRIREHFQPAITSGIVRARHGAVQGSPLRSDRTLRVRLARVNTVRKRNRFLEARDLDATASERRNLAVT